MKKFLTFIVALTILIGGAGFSLASESSTNNSKSGDVVPYWNRPYSVFVPKRTLATTETATKSRPDNKVYWHHQYSGGKQVKIRVENVTKETATSYYPFDPGDKRIFLIAAHSGKDSMMGRIEASWAVDVLAQGSWNP